MDDSLDRDGQQSSQAAGTASMNGQGDTARVMLHADPSAAAGAASGAEPSADVGATPPADPGAQAIVFTDDDGAAHEVPVSYGPPQTSDSAGPVYLDEHGNPLWSSAGPLPGPSPNLPRDLAVQGSPDAHAEPSQPDEPTGVPQADAAAIPELQAVHDEMRQRYVDDGETPEDAEKLASADVLKYSDMAEETGMTPTELLRLYNPKTVLQDEPTAGTESGSHMWGPGEGSDMQPLEQADSRVCTPFGSNLDKQDLLSLTYGTTGHGGADRDQLQDDKAAAARAHIGFLLATGQLSQRLVGKEQSQTLVDAQDAAMANRKYRPTTTNTHCSEGARDIAKGIGADLTGILYDAKGNFYNANTQINHLANSNSYHVVTPDQAQALANKGVLVFGTQHGAVHGHIASVRPEGVLGDKPSGKSGPILANIGRFNGVAHQSAVMVPARGAIVYYAPHP